MQLSVVNRLVEPIAPTSPALVPDSGHIRAEPMAGASAPARSDRVSAWAALTAAAALHGAVFASLLLGPGSDPISGAGGQHLEAIDIAIVSSRVIETRNADQRVAPDAASAPVAPKEGDQAEPEIAARQQQTVAEPEQIEAEQIEVKPEREAMPQPRQQGGATALVIEGGDNRASGPAAATSGAIQLYAAQVRAVLARSKPAGRGRRGTATITFGIDPSGKTAFARITGSSGNPAFDRAAQDVVTRASFPPPPAGMSETQRSYVIPFHLK